MTIRLSHVVACSENGIIGRDGAMPWHLPTELKRFKALTMGHVLIMGRKTFVSIGRPLPGRYSIVVSRSQVPLPRVVSPAESLEEAYALAEDSRAHWPEEVFVVGGGEIYRQTLDRTSRIYLTRVHIEAEGDVSYPLEALRDFYLLSEEKLKDGGTSFSIQCWERLRDENDRAAPAPRTN